MYFFSRAIAATGILSTLAILVQSRLYSREAMADIGQPYLYERELQHHNDDLFACHEDPTAEVLLKRYMFEVHCPHCNSVVLRVPSDGKEELSAKCNRCKIQYRYVLGQGLQSAGRNAGYY
jgi:hypothetical protein